MVFNRMAKVVVLWAALLPWCAQSEDMMSTGTARIIDGDTIEISGEVHRLHGIDAPERKQACRTQTSAPWPCGARATDALRDHIAGRDVTCIARTKGHYGRWISVCYVPAQGLGQDLNAWMVRQGWALAYRRYSRDYVFDEDTAKTQKRGLWTGTFLPPWLWRRKAGTK